MSFANSFKNGLFDIQERNFNEKAIELFNYQAENNLIYKKYLQLLKTDPQSVTHITQIPFLPIRFFKNHKIVTGNFEYQAVFYSSGTTGNTRSAHYIHDLAFYKRIAVYAFESFYGKLEDKIILALLPGYTENKNSSLICMIDHFIGQTNNLCSGFVLNDFKAIESRIKEAREQGRQIILWGVSFALLDLAEKFPMDLSGVILFETGGMKGRRKEMIREELHDVLKKRLNISTVHSEYGMTELLSQAYSAGEGLFKTPPWMKIMIREPYDPFSVGTGRGSGGLNVVDLGNVDSCAFIETEDLGKVLDDTFFEVIGRLDNSDIRGCNLLYMS